jgi:serine/threonine-protein kinase
MSSEPTAKPESKKMLGRYEVLTRIGAGGMAAVYKAMHVDLGREVALKVMPPEMAARRESVERFRKEAQLAAKLRHENIVTIYEVGESNGTHFLAMEYVDGTDLQNYIAKKGKLDPEEARRIAIQATRALALAHKHGIVHRDIKPSNLLMSDRDGKYIIKLTDFGLARLVEDTDYNITRAGTTIGTVDYISPEQARNSRSADIRSDIYSLGCTLYHMLAGNPPFFEGDLTERLLKHVESEPEDVRRANPKVPAGLAIVLQKMMAKKPEGRYQTPAELLQDLEQLPRGEPLTSREVLAALAQEDEARSRAARSSAGATRKAARSDSIRVMERPAPSEPASRRGPGSASVRRTRDAHEVPPVEGIETWMIWAAVGIVVAIIFVIILLIAWKRDTARAVSVESTSRQPGISGIVIVSDRLPTPEVGWIGRPAAAPLCCQVITVGYANFHRHPGDQSQQNLPQTQAIES